MPDALYLDNDLEVEIALSRKAATTGALEAAAGVTGLSAYLAATPQGAAIHANVTVNLTERSGAPGRYFGLLQGTDLTTQLSSYLNQTVWLVATNSAKDVEYVKPYTIRRDRGA